MNSQRRSRIRISCPQCGGKVKVPPFQAGQSYLCPRCGAEIVAPGQSPPKEPEAVDGQASAAASDSEMLRLAGPGVSVENDAFGITCQVCGTRLHVHPLQIGTTVKCPDCYSPVSVTEPPKRNQPWQVARQAWDDADSPVDGPAAIQVEAQTRLEKAKAEQEQEEAEERERSPEQFTEGFLSFLADPQALARLATLAIWFELTMVLFRYVTRMRISENAPAIISQLASLVAMLALTFMFLTFLFAVAACGLALVKDTSAGLRKIGHWPEFNFLCWGRDVFYIANAGCLAALPGVALGTVLSFVGVSGSVLYTAAASFGALFPPTLLSMFESNSSRAPFLKEAWRSIRERPEPWKLTYLITTIVIIAGLFAFVSCLVSGFLLGAASGFLFGLIVAMVMVALIMIYFRTVGRLFCYLAGRDVTSTTGSRQHSSES